MNEGSRMQTADFFREAEQVYGWDLIEREKIILYEMAKEQSGSVVLDNWRLFQSRFPGHPAWEFQEWIQDILVPDEEGEYEQEEL